MVELDPDLVKRFTGQNEICSVSDARAQLARASAELGMDQKRRRLAVWRCFRIWMILNWYRSRFWLASRPAAMGVEAWSVLLVIAAGSAAMGIIVALLLGGRALAIVLSAASPFLLFTVISVLFPADLSWLRQRLASFYEQQFHARRAALQAAQTVSLSQRRYQGAALIYRGLVRAANGPLQRLLSANFRAMSGGDFERYLEEVFNFLGYAVERVGGAGDQGVDLIVTTERRRIAVQAKCYNNAVGNSPVQEVYTGMRVHGCSECVVIASSGYTSGAVEAARAVGCRLISGDDIPSLIRGHMRL